MKRGKLVTFAVKIKTAIVQLIDFTLGYISMKQTLRDQFINPELFRMRWVVGVCPITKTS